MFLLLVFGVYLTCEDVGSLNEADRNGLKNLVFRVGMRVCNLVEGCYDAYN